MPHTLPKNSLSSSSINGPPCPSEQPCLLTGTRTAHPAKRKPPTACSRATD